MLAIVVAMAPVGVLIAGCSSEPAALADTPSATPTTPVDCGRATPGPLEPIPAPNLDCFVPALAAGTPATLVVVQLSVEGDPISEAYTVVGPNTAHIRTDSTADRFRGSGPRLLEQTCTVRVSAGLIMRDGCAE
jgi:hypothetical protein